MKHIAARYVRKYFSFFLLSGLLLLVKESIHWVSQYSWGTSCCIYFTQSKAIPISSLRFGLHLDLILHQGPFRLWGDLEKTLWAWTWNVWSSLSSVSFELIITQEDLCWDGLAALLFHRTIISQRFSNSEDADVGFLNRFKIHGIKMISKSYLRLIVDAESSSRTWKSNPFYFMDFDLTNKKFST